MVIVPFTQTRDLRGLKEPIPSGHTLQLYAMVKYLGLILDKRLTWKVKNVISLTEHFGPEGAHLVKHRV
jgi:hypothetical protein